LIDNDDCTTCELSLTAGHMCDDEMKDVDSLLKTIGLSLSDPNVWIGDTGATMHNTAYVVDIVNHWQATMQDNIIGVTGMPVEARTIVDIPVI
jgi:hypothetical protein